MRWRLVSYLSIFLAAIVLLPSPALAMQRRSWLCQSTLGAPIPACSITVYLAGTTTKATIYSDQAGSTTLGNPFTAGSDGTYAYYAANGRYTEALTAPGYSFSAAQTQDFILNDPFVAASPASATATIWNGNQLTLAGTNNNITFTDTAGLGAIIFPNPTTNSNPIVWNNAGNFIEIVGNSAGTGLTNRTTSGPFTLTILRGDIAAGAQDLGNLNFEMPNASGNAYRAGYIRGKQTSNVAGAEAGYINVETITGGVVTERVRFGDPAFGAALSALSNGFQFAAQYDTSHHYFIFHNGSNAYVGTYESNPVVLRTANTDALVIGASQGIYTPNATGTDKGADTINALSYYANNNQFVNASGAIINKSVTFNSGLLNTLTANGMMIYCSDCTAAGALDQTCVGGGSGNLAVRINGVAKCAY